MRPQGVSPGGTLAGAERRTAMAPVAGTHYLAGPVIAFAVVGGPALFLRWAYRSDPGRRPPADDGLLTRVPAPHRAEVLVFPEDADRARALAASFRPN